MSLIPYQKKSVGIPTAPVLDRPVTSLAEHVQTIMGSFFTIQQHLVLNKKAPKEFLDEFKEDKQLFKSQCENMQRVLQTYYRHASDYATLSQRGVDARVPAATRCLSSAKSVHRETQELHRTFQTIVTGLNKRRSDLTRYLKTLNKTRSATLPGTTDVDQLPRGDRSALQTLYSAVDGVQECIRDMIAFWDYHIASLESLIRGQTNFPSLGEEAKAIFGLWTDYQATLLQSSNSISASADALTVNPRIVKRRDTFPTTRAEWAQYQDTDRHFDGSKGTSHDFMYSLKSLTVKIVKPLRDLGKYIRTKMVGNEPNVAGT